MIINKIQDIFRWTFFQFLR